MFFTNKRRSHSCAAYGFIAVKRNFYSVLDIVHFNVFLQHGKEIGNYIQNELEALEREQKQIDKQAAVLEKELRSVMEAGSNTHQEEFMMANWFTLVNKKNALIRRQMQLNIL